MARFQDEFGSRLIWIVWIFMLILSTNCLLIRNLSLKVTFRVRVRFRFRIRVRVKVRSTIGVSS